MALTLGPAQCLNPGATDQQWIFDIILDGAATTATVNLPTNFPAFSANPGPAVVAGAINLTVASAAAFRVVYQNTLGGTSAVVRAVKIVPTPTTATTQATQIDITVSAAGTNLQTVRVLAIVKDLAY